MKSSFCTLSLRMCPGFYPTSTLAIVETALAANRFSASAAERISLG